MFRAAHSLKGAARAVNANTIESLTHRLEHALSELRGSDKPVDPGKMQMLFAQVDAVKEAAGRLRLDAATALANTGAPAQTTPRAVSSRRGP